MLSESWPVQRIDTYADDAVGRLAAQYDAAQNLEKLIRQAADRYQGLENVFWSLLTERGLSTSVGKQLDGIGSIIGEPRIGRGDDEYRSAIRVRIALNKAAGEPENVIAFIVGLTDATRVAWKEIYPAKVQAYVDAPITLSEAQRIRSLLPAAVGAAFIETTDGERPFGVDGLGTEEPDPDALGFGELGLYVIADENGDIFEAGDGTIIAGNDIEAELEPDSGGAFAEVFEI